MKLVIVESPSKAKTISKYLGDDFEVRASVGHIRDLPKSNKKALDIPNGYIPHYEISKGKEKTVSEIMSDAKNADEVILATDPDREGEAIAWHVKEACKLKNPKRVVFHEITEEAVKDAMEHPREIDMKLKTAQEARRVLDRLFGYDLSGLIWKKVRYGLSAGRVQSPALRIIVEREREIKNFIPENFFIINGEFETKNKQKIFLTCEKEPKSIEETEEILKIAKKGDWKVSDVKETTAKRSPRPPFTTSTLQQSASSRLGFSPSRTMRIAQKLYEAGHISYMRTDSVNLADSALRGIYSAIEKKYGKELICPRKYSAKSKNAQEAHEAVRPTHIENETAGGSEEEKKLYKLIRERTIASQMKDAMILRTKITALTADCPQFSVTGSRTVSPGWLLADPRAKGEDVELPKISNGEDLKLINILSTAKQTEPPSRYTEAGLVKELEKRDIGRPSTYASIIKTIIDRKYVEKIDRSLKPTDTGEVVSGFLEENFGKYISDEFTSKMEDELDLIAVGEAEYIKVLDDFYKPFSKDVKLQSKSEKITNLGEADKKFKCPKCGSSMVIKLGRIGKFISCSRYPDCDGALTIDGHEIKKDEPIGNHPETGEPIFIKIGRFGPYVQLGEKKKGSKLKPKMGSIPKDKDLSGVTMNDALKYLSLPRKLGVHPESGLDISANNGRFGPYIVHNGDFRSIKTPLNVYDIDIEKAIQILNEPKKTKKRGFKKK